MKKNLIIIIFIFITANDCYTAHTTTPNDFVKIAEFIQHKTNELGNSSAFTKWFDEKRDKLSLKMSTNDPCELCGSTPCDELLAEFEKKYAQDLKTFDKEYFYTEPCCSNKQRYRLTHLIEIVAQAEYEDDQKNDVISDDEGCPSDYRERMQCDLFDAEKNRYESFKTLIEQKQKNLEILWGTNNRLSISGAKKLPDECLSKTVDLLRDIPFCVALYAFGNNPLSEILRTLRYLTYKY